jgi:DNA processing protein
MTDNNLPYWMAFAHARDFTTRRKMEFLLQSVFEKYTIQEALTRVRSNDKLGFNFSEKEWNGLKEAINELANYSFLAESIEDQGIVTMNILDRYVYPKTLKENLKKEAPILIYAKGNMDLLKKDSIAIVGARISKPVSLEFTDNVARKAVKKNHVVVSGFAKGVDKKALDAALEYKGQSIIVLPQGIETYKSKTYYRQIVSGDVLVISIYHPKAPWSVGLAMDRNKIIYGLAHHIYAAESNNSGGTWEGVQDGLKRGRKVYVRQPNHSEKNANDLLIQKGATPVDMQGNELEKITADLFHEPVSEFKSSKEVNLPENDFLDLLIRKLQEMEGEGLTIMQIIEMFKPDEKLAVKLSTLLNKSPYFKKEKKGRFNYYKLNNTKRGNMLF